MSKGLLFLSFFAFKGYCEFISIYDEVFEEVPCEQNGGSHPPEAYEDEGSEEIRRPIGLRYDFIEICGVSGVVTKELLALGASCGQVLDLSLSR